MALFARSSLDAAGSLLAMGCAAFIAFASAACFVLLPFIMWMIFGDQHAAGHWGSLWVLLTIFVLFFNITRAVEVFREQKPRDLALMILATCIVVMSCPLTLRAFLP
jgi:hypothetical protein